MNTANFRIGNIIKWNDDNNDNGDCCYMIKDITEISVVAHCLNENYAWYAQDWTIPKDEIIGVTLTPELLFACSFKYQDRDINAKELQRFYISYNFGDHREYWLEMNFPRFEDDRWFWWLNWNHGGSNNFVHLPLKNQITTLHELQNWWYVNAKEEIVLGHENMMKTMLHAK